MKINKFSIKTAVIFSVLVFLILLSTMFLSFGVIMLLYHAGILDGQHRAVPILMFAIVSIIVGVIFSKVFGKRPIQVIEQFSDATKEIAKGNFNLQVNEDIPAAEFRTMAHNFNIMAKELSHTEILRNDFIENVSHEFKTPLSAIEGYAMLLQKKGLSDEKRAEYTGKILHNAKRLSTLSGNILLLSRLENQEIEVKKETYSLDEQIREIILLLEEKWSDKKIDLDIELDDVAIRANEGLMAHVWQNILENAIKFVPAEGAIGISLHQIGNYAQINISDNGIGMDKEELSRVYEKFYQADSSRSTTGNGLGLTLAKRIIDLHHGKIEISSAKGKGTSFTITLLLQ